MKKIFTFLLIAFLSVNLSAQSLNSDLLKKVDPILHSIIKMEPGLLKTANLSLPGIIENKEDILQLIVKTNNIEELRAQGFDVNSSFLDLATVRIKPVELTKLALLNSVNFISVARLNYPANDVGGAVIGAKLLNSGYVNNTQYNGQDVLLCIIDTGIDWKHLDFRGSSDSTKSRIVYLWDQTLTKIGTEKTPADRDATNFSGLNYGVEYSVLDINDELDSSPSNFVREEDTNGHGTHVAGTAGGNGNTLSDKKYAGIAPKADLLIVKAGNGSFTESHIIDALEYAKKIATQLGKSIVVNMSLGSSTGPHDGTTPQDQAVDNFVTSANGRVCVISAGNSGSDIIHISGSLSVSTSINISVNIPSGYTLNALPNNDYFYLDFWSSTSGSLSISAITPNSISVSSSTSTNDGRVEIYNSVDGNNNNREIVLYVYDQDAAKPPASGNWVMKVTNNGVSTITYHCWLESSMSATINGGDANYTVGSPGTASNALTVGSFATRWRWLSINENGYYMGTPDRSDNISSFSSIGPRRDGMLKPDITAPGQLIISARSSSTNPDSTSLVANGKYLVEQGTSMSAPITAGSVALLLQQQPNLAYDGVKNLITSNSTIDSYTGTVPNNSWGYGKLNIFSSMVNLINPGWANNFKTYVYDQWNTVQYTYTNVSPGQKFAIKFTPEFSGQLTGALLHTFISNGITSPLYFEIWSDNGGIPGSKLGNTVSYNASDLALYTWNFIDLQGNDVIVNSGTDYYLVTYFTSGTATGILIDDGTIDSRTFRDYNDGNGWSVKTYDMRMRPIIATDKSSLVGLKETLNIPLKYELYNNYPNPFNPTTVIKYQLSQEGFVTLKIYDVLGREVQTLVNKEQDAGIYQVQLKADNLSSGVYFYRIKAGNFVETKKMILLK
jgi:subtilisin family serine protease